MSCNCNKGSRYAASSFIGGRTIYRNSLESSIKPFDYGSYSYEARLYELQTTPLLSTFSVKCCSLERNIQLGLTRSKRNGGCCGR